MYYNSIGDHIFGQALVQVTSIIRPIPEKARNIAKNENFKETLASLCRTLINAHPETMYLDPDTKETVVGKFTWMFAYHGQHKSLQRQTQKAFENAYQATLRSL